MSSNTEVAEALSHLHIPWCEIPEVLSHEHIPSCEITEGLSHVHIRMKLRKS